MIVDRLFKKRAGSVVVVLASISFVVGCIYMYRIPLSTVSSYLLTLLVLLLMVVGLAGLLVAGVILLRRLFAGKDD